MTEFTLWMLTIATGGNLITLRGLMRRVDQLERR